MIAILGINANAQLTKEILLKDLYADATTLKLKDSVVQVPEKNKKEIRDAVKFFLSSVFHNLNEVTASDTDDIIVINYVIVEIQTTYTIGIPSNVRTVYNIRIELKFKDGKMKVEMYDAGNGAVTNVVENYVLYKPNTFHLDKYFEKGVIKPIDMKKKKFSESGFRTANEIISQINSMFIHLTKAPFQDNW